jgi:hypothetical protein
MIPFIQKGDLTKLPSKRRNNICGCQTSCREFFTFTTYSDDSDFILCAGDAKQFGFEILEKAGVVTQSHAFPKSKRGWTTEQERFVIKYIKENHRIDENGRMKDGTYTLIGEMLGKTREQVKDKVNHLRRFGRV